MMLLCIWRIKFAAEKEKVDQGEEAAKKAGMKPKKGKKAGEVTDKKKEEKEDSAIGLVVVDTYRGARAKN